MQADNRKSSAKKNHLIHASDCQQQTSALRTPRDSSEQQPDDPPQPHPEFFPAISPFPPRKRKTPGLPMKATPLTPSPSSQIPGNQGGQWAIHCSNRRPAGAASQRACSRYSSHVYTAPAAAATAASPAVSQLPNNVCSRGPSCSHEPLALPSNLPESRSIPLSEEERSPACIISGAALQGAVAVAAAAAAAIYSRRKKNRARCTTRLVFSLVPQARCREKAKCTMQMRRMHRRSELAKKKIVQVRWNCTRLCPGASHSLDDAALPYQRCPLFLFFS